MKRITCILCICVFMLQFVTLPHVSAVSDDNYTLLYDLGLIKAENTLLSEKITYEDLARTAVMLTTGGVADEKSDFIQIAKDAGLILGKATGDVSSSEAIKTILRAVGYKHQDKEVEEGFFELDAGRNIHGDVTVANSSAIVFSELCGFLKNILEEKCLVYDGYNYVTSAKTVLEEKFEIKILDGILYTGDVLAKSDDFVEINGQSYGCAKDFSQYSGRKVRAYIDDDEVISVDIKRFKNEISVISANDITNVSQTSISFYDANGKIVTRDISSDAKEIYNGYLCDFKYSDMDMSNGIITLIKHPGSAEYNVIKINQYDIMVAGGVGNNIIYDYNGQGMNVRVDDSLLSLKITHNCEEISLSDIQKYDVLLLMYTKNREKLIIDVVRNTVSGTVSAISDEYIKIGRRSYIKSSYFKNYSKDVYVGDEVEILLDSTGLAIGIKPAVSSKEQYGYFMGMYTDVADERYRVRLLTEEGQINDFELKEKFTLNGESVKNTGLDAGALPDTMRTLVECSTEGEKVVRTVNDYVYQLLIYSTDSEGKISYIDTAIENSSENEDKELTLDMFVDGNKRYKSSPMQFVDSFGMSNDFTKVFYVPVSDNVFDENGNLDKVQRSAATRRDYEIASPGILRNDQDDAVAGAYCVSGGGVAKAVVIYNTNIGAKREFAEDSAEIFILTKILQGMNDDEELCYILEGYVKGAETVFTMDIEDFGQNENDVFVEPQVGDIMQIQADTHNHVVSYATRYRGTENINYYPSIGNNIWSQFGNYAGYVYDQDEYGITTVSDLSSLGNKRIAMKKNISDVFVYDIEANTVTKADVNSTVSYKDAEYDASRVFMRGNYGVINTMIIFVNGEED